MSSNECDHKENVRRLLVSTERFLESCEDIAFHGADRGREDLVSWKTSQTFHRYIEILEDRIEDLLVSSGSLQDEYGGRALDCKRRLDVLSDMLEPIHLIESLGGTKDALKIMKEYSITKGTLTPGSMEFIHGSQEGLSTRGGSGAPGQGKQIRMAGRVGQKSSFQPISISDAAKNRLEKQSLVQEALTDELVDMASALKESTHSIQARVQAREALLDTTEEALETSVQGTRNSVAKVEKARQTSRINFCFTMLVILVLALGCAAMVVFIRITSFVGYKRQRDHKEL